MSWLFVSKIPNVGYSVHFSKDILTKFINDGYKSLEMYGNDDDKKIHLKPSINKSTDLTMNLVIDSGPRKDNVKDIFNSRDMHVLLCIHGYFPTSEFLMEEVYGFRFDVTWNDSEKVFIVTKN